MRDDREATGRDGPLRVLVAEDETIVEISTDKVDAEVPAPASGTIAEILAEAYRERVVRTDDAKEGPAAFMEKRPPEWTGT